MEIQLGQPAAKADVVSSQKEMLSVSFEEFTSLEDSISVTRTRPVVRINNSSLDLIQTCKRKAYFALERNLKSNEESTALSFGTAVHKGLETWYSESRTTRRDSTCKGDRHDDSEHLPECITCRSISSFMSSCGPCAHLDLGDKRHPYNGVRILQKYFEKYADDPFEILVDSHGPIVERRVEFTLIDEPNLKVIFFGTIDAILKNTETGVILVCDHKTTSTLGSDFYNRIKPNFQYTGYVMGARKCLNLDTNLFLVNGLQVAKTKADLARQVTQRDEEDFKELTVAVRYAVEDYLKCKETGVWPQTSPGPCTQWGGCQFRNVCEVPSSLRENVITSMFKGDKSAIS